MNKNVEETQTIKVRVRTHDDLKVLAALRKKSMLEMLDWLVQEELKRIEEEKRRAQDV